VKTALVALLTFVTIASAGCQPFASKSSPQSAAPAPIGVEELRATGR